MRPEKVTSWRGRLPPPFDKPSNPAKRRASCGQIEHLTPTRRPSQVLRCHVTPRRRRGSTPAAVDQADRAVTWLRYIHAQRARNQAQKSASALEKLDRLSQSGHQSFISGTTPTTADDFDLVAKHELLPQTWATSNTAIGEPSLDEISALVSECFPPIEESRVIITEYTNNAHLTSEFSLEEVLASEYILQPGDLVSRVRWIYVEYYKMGTFWGSDYRFSQWGTDPALFEKLPISLLQDRLAELDRKAGRPPLHTDDLPGYKRIGKYHRQNPGSPEYLGVRTNSDVWLKSAPCQLLLNHLASRPNLSNFLQRRKGNELAYTLAYINALQCIRNTAYQARPGLRDVHDNAELEEVYAYGSWDDHVERLEFYREHTLLTCGSPRLYKVVADRLLRAEDVLRKHPDSAFLYYTLARVSIENDEMMQDQPERALNKVFSRLKDSRNTDLAHVEVIFNLQQTILDGLEYLEENKRELPIWGLPPFGNHQVTFHPDHNPPAIIRDLIQSEMDLVDKDFDKIIEHWKHLRRKVERHLDVLLQFRVLEQQELAFGQRHMATRGQHLAIEEAKSSRVQSRSVTIFTAITIIFLPLSFFTSYFGMNLTDIVKTKNDSTHFWRIAGPTSGGIVLMVFAIAKIMASTVSNPRSTDLENAYTQETEAEKLTSWRSRLKLTRDKMKNS